MLKVFQRFSSAQLFLFLSVSLFLLLAAIYPFFIQKDTIELSRQSVSHFVNIYSVSLVIVLLIFAVRQFKLLGLNDRFRSFLLLLMVLAAASQLTGYSVSLLLLFAFFSFVYAVKQKRFHKPLWLFWVFWIYYAVQLSGLIGSPDLREGIHMVKSQIAFLVFPLAFCAYRPTRAEFRLFSTFALRFAIAFMLVFLFNYLLMTYSFDNSPLSAFTFDKNYFKIPYFRPNPTDVGLSWAHFIHPSFIFIVLQTILIIASLQYRADAKSNRVKGKADMRLFELILLAVSFVLFAFVTQSRIAMLMTLLVFSLWLFVEIFMRSRKLAAVLLLLASVSVLLLAPRVMKSSFMNNVDRQTMFEHSIRAAERNPFFGARVGAAAGLLQPFVLEGEPRHPHNQLITEILHFGWPGIAVFVLIMGSVFFYAIRHRKYMLLVYASLLLALMMVESPFTHTRGAYSAVFWLSLLALAPAMREVEPQRIEE